MKLRHDRAGSIEVYGVTLDVTQTFDGDGRAMKKLAVNTVLGGAGGDESTFHITYLLRSSVLGGQVITELGASERGFVYLGGAVLAVQERPTQTVKWEHRDIGNASLRMTSSNGTVSSEGLAELDPLGSNAGVSAPETPSPAQYWKMSGYPGLGSPGTSMTCIMDFIPTPCTELARARNSIEQCPDNDCGHRIIIDPNGDEHLVPLTRNPDTGSLSYRVTHEVFDPNWEDENKKWKKKSVYLDAAADPQKTLTIEHFTAAQESWIRYEMQFILTKKCSDAYEAERLHSPSSIISDRGVVIRHAEDLRNRSAEDLGLHPQTYRDAQRKANLGQAATGFGADGRLHIFLNNKAFLGPSWASGYASLAEVLKHEFIHEGLASWPDPTPLIGGRRHDLAGFPGYNRIMEGCR